jgi:hypothetical protein
MQITSSSLYDTSINYSIRLNEKEELIFEDDKLRTPKEKTEYEKLQAKDEDKKAKESEKSSTQALSTEEKQITSELQARDTEVRAHEAAHQSGGAATGAASYTYQKGPDGRMYAIGGEVPVSMKSGSTPQETIANAQAVIASAMAPADPSGQDQAVAASAMMMITKAQQQLAQEKQNELIAKEVYKNAVDKDNSSRTSKIPALDKLDISA